MSGKSCGPKILLASSSPRRAEILEQSGIPFELLLIDSGSFEKELEADGSFEPLEFAIEAADGKLQIALVAAGAKNSGDIVLCADTIVALDGAIFGKPRDRGDAARMLRALSGKTHQVITGCAMATADGARKIKFAVETDVEFYPMSYEAIAAYVDSGEPMDKAGAYGIQARAAVFTKGIQGCYDNVVGLPVGAVVRALDKVFGIKVEDIWRNGERV